MFYTSQFCIQNYTSIEFFPNHFLVKDLSTGASLVQGWNRNNLYECPSHLPPTVNNSQPHTSLVSYGISALVTLHSQFKGSYLLVKIFQF